MEAELTYLVHSGFTLDLGDRVLLFDYPGGRFSSEGLKDIVKGVVKGKKLYVFVSHSHGDHYNPDIMEFAAYAEDIKYILSSDVPATRISGENYIRVKARGEYRLDNMVIRTFESNDAGVAFLVEVDDRKVYFGGDLAKWDWQEWSERKRKQHVDIFDRAVEELKKEKIDIAFSNMDERLESWAGPVEFIEEVRPKYFVPIHTFGHEGWVDDLVGRFDPDYTEIITYEKSGDVREIEL